MSSDISQRQVTHGPIGPFLRHLPQSPKGNSLPLFPTRAGASESFTNLYNEGVNRSVPAFPPYPSPLIQNVANAPNDLRAYIELIAGLPRPTDEQRDNFVNFVAGAHSWYKHLSILPPGTDFCFFLNPNSGRTRIHTPSGETGFVDRTEDDEIKFHYTWMTTANYRQ